MSLRFKDGVSVRQLSTQQLFIMETVRDVMEVVAGVNCWVTSLNDGRHSFTSLHWSNAAVDFRSKHLPNLETKYNVLDAIRERFSPFGRDYDVILEDVGTDNEHYHVEWQPKSRG